MVWAPVCCSLLGCPSPRRQQAPGLRRFAKQASGATFEGSLRVLTPRGLSSDLNLRAVAKAQTHLPWNHCILVRAGSLPPALQPLGQVCQAPRGILVRKSSLLPLQPPRSEAKSRAAVPSSGVRAMDVVPWARLRQPHLGAVFSGRPRQMQRLSTGGSSHRVWASSLLLRAAFKGLCHSVTSLTVVTWAERNGGHAVPVSQTQRRGGKWHICPC